MTKNILIIGFSLTKQYSHKSYNNFLKQFSDVYFTSPYKYYFRTNFFSNLQFLKKTILNILKNKFNHDIRWVKFNYLKKYDYFSKLTLLNPELKHSYKNLKKAFLLTKNLSKSIDKDFFKFEINGVDCAGYMIDSLLRFFPNFKIFKIKSPFSFASAWLYIYDIITYLEWLENFVKKNKIKSVLINHTVYMESGFISNFLKKKFNIKIFYLSVKNKYPVLISSKETWYRNILKKKLLKIRSSNKKLKFKNKKELWQTKHALAEIEDCSKKTFDKKTIVIVMHCFTDGNGMYSENGVIFNSYFQWIRFTLSIAKKNKDIKYIFRSHPDSFRIYKSDRKILNYLFNGIKEKNIKLETIGNYSQLISKNKVPLFISAKGNFSQEIAIAGIKSITLDNSAAPDECCKKITNKKEYIKWVSGKGDYNELRLSKRLRLLAKINKEIYSETNKYIIY